MFRRRKRHVEQVVGEEGGCGEKMGVASFCASIGNAILTSDVVEDMPCSSGGSGGEVDANGVESVVTSLRTNPGFTLLMVIFAILVSFKMEKTLASREMTMYGPEYAGDKLSLIELYRTKT